MDNGHDMLQLCRLCLVKDDVNIPIFQEHDDNSEIFVKISSCLPVKLERNDKLPQNICDSCFSKLDVVYDLWTTSSNSDKQLHKWLYEAEAANAKEKRLTKASNKSGDAIVKQEKIDDAHETVTYVEEVPWDGASSSAGPSASLTAEDEPPPKRARRAAAVKASITVAAESDDDDDDDNGPMTKMEDDSDENDPTFGDVPSTSADDQPGPSGVGKDGSEAPIFIDAEIDIMCRKCEQPFDSLQKYFNHLGFDGDNTCQCCKLIIPDMNDSHWEEHLDKITLMHIKSVIENKFICEKCDLAFSEYFELREHIHKLHSNESKKQCYLCEKTISLHGFTKHLSVVHQIKGNHVCTVCGAVFDRDSMLRRHRLSQHGINLCEVCGILLRSSLKRHMMKHSPDNIFKCDKCDKSFKILDQLRKHLVVHESFGIYSCDICSKSFKRLDNLKVHKFSHESVKPFPCGFCVKTFTTKQSRNIHIHTHFEKK